MTARPTCICVTISKRFDHIFYGYGSIKLCFKLIVNFDSFSKGKAQALADDGGV